MAFDLAVFGGTGQWVLLEFLLRHLRGETVELPENVWIVDPHQPDVARSLPAQLRSVEERAGRPSLRIRPTRDARLTTTLDSVLDDELKPPAQYEQLRQLLSSAATVYERSYSTERGFFALPRLAASWIALAGFETPPPFLEDLYLEAAGNPLIITGSLAGGTGSGLIPQVLLRTRAKSPDHWKRTVIVQAILPWFNPELGSAAGTGDTVKWAQCERNAADGVRALKRIMNDIAVRAPGGQLDLPETLCSVAGIPPEVAERTAPPEHQQVASSGVTPPFIRAVGDSLLHLAEERVAEATAAVEKVVFGPATLAVPRGSANDPLARRLRGAAAPRTEQRRPDEKRPRRLQRNCFAASRLRKCAGEVVRGQGVDRIQLAFATSDYGVEALLGQLDRANDDPRLVSGRRRKRRVGCCRGPKSDDRHPRQSVRGRSAPREDASPGGRLGRDVRRGRTADRRPVRRRPPSRRIRRPFGRQGRVRLSRTTRSARAHPRGGGRAAPGVRGC
jgi:hypothetical protein